MEEVASLVLTEEYYRVPSLLMRVSLRDYSNDVRHKLKRLDFSLVDEVLATPFFGSLASITFCFYPSLASSVQLESVDRALIEGAILKTLPRLRARCSIHVEIVVPEVH